MLMISNYCNDWIFCISFSFLYNIRRGTGRKLFPMTLRPRIGLFSLVSESIQRARHTKHPRLHLTFWPLPFVCLSKPESCTVLLEGSLSSTTGPFRVRNSPIRLFPYTNGRTPSKSTTLLWGRRSPLQLSTTGESQTNWSQDIKVIM